MNFTATREQVDAIVKIADRARRLGIVRTTRMSLMMDIEAAHSNGCPLDFDKLLAFDDFNFAHDVSGIQGTINRDTGELTHCFLPRCSAQRNRSRH